MNFEEFKEKLMEDLKQALYEQTGEEYSVNVSTVNKLQNESYEVFTVKAEGSQIGVNLIYFFLYSEISLRYLF